MLRDSPVIVTSLPESGILYFKSSHSEKFSMEMGVWSFRKICWIEAGSGKLEFRDRVVEFSQGDLLTVTPNVEHRFVDNKGEPCTLSMICYDDSKLPEGFKKVHNDVLQHIPEGKVISLSDPWRWNFMHHHFRKLLIEQSNKNIAYQEMIKSGFIELLVFLVRVASAEEKSVSGSSKERMIQGLINHLEENFIDDMSVDDLAEICNMSTRSLSRHFKDITGKTIVQYITELRIAYACERLRETRQIAFSAFDAGFNDISFFYRTFKKHIGVTPKEFLNLGPRAASPHNS